MKLSLQLTLVGAFVVLMSFGIIRDPQTSPIGTFALAIGGVLVMYGLWISGKGR